MSLANPQNAASFAAVDSALFVVALDAGVAGLGPEDMSRNVLYGLEVSGSSKFTVSTETEGSNYNRWIDK